jgi:hypothetical protein
VFVAFLVFFLFLLSTKRDTSAQKDLNHRGEGEPAIGDLHEQGPLVRALIQEGEPMTQPALQLLKAYQIEAHVHPLLEDTSTYAQG